MKKLLKEDQKLLKVFTSVFEEKCHKHASLAYLLIVKAGSLSNMDKKFVAIETKGEDTKGQLYIFYEMSAKVDK